MKPWHQRYTALALFLVVAGLGLVAAPRIGVSWDEPDNIYAGGVYWNFFRMGDLSTSAFGGRIYSQNTELVRYPPVPNYVGTAIAAFVQNPITAYHVATALFFGILVATVFLFARSLGLSSPMSTWAALAAFGYPTLFGYGFSNLKDTAQAGMFIVSLYLLVRGKLVWGAVSWGLAMATKLNAIYVPIVWVVGEFRGIKKFFLVFLVGLGVAFLVWPYVWFDPLRRAMEVVHYFTSVGQGYAIWWNGELFHVGVGQPLWWYPWGHLVVNTPIPILVLAAIGAVKAIKTSKYRILIIWLVMPLLRALLPNAAFYDGLRHFVEVLPALVLLSTLGLSAVSRHWPKTATIIAAVTLLHLATINAILFPYSSGYYNALVPGANERFDRDIEALSVRESIDWLHETYGAIRLYLPIGKHLGWYLLTAEDHDAYRIEDADTVVLVNKSSHIRRSEFEQTIPADFELVHTISRGKSAFAWIYRRR